MSIWENSFESRYPEKLGDDEHPYGTQAGELDKLTEFISWVVSTKRKEIPANATDEEKASIEAYNLGQLRKFKNELSSHCHVDSALFYYLYTELFLMVDSRAKNATFAWLNNRDGSGRGK